MAGALSGKAGYPYFGLLIATIGQDPVGGINRFNFGFADLAAGIAFVPAPRFFAVSEIFVQAEKRATGTFIAQGGHVFPTLFELWAQKIAVLRSILVGFFVAFYLVLVPH